MSDLSSRGTGPIGKTDSMWGKKHRARVAAQRKRLADLDAVAPSRLDSWDRRWHQAIREQYEPPAEDAVADEDEKGAG